MAEDQDNSQKTEDPTQRKLEEARKKGDVAKSTDVPIWFLILATAAIMSGAGPLAGMLAAPLVRIMDHPHAFRLENGGAQQLMGSLLMALALPLMIVPHLALTLWYGPVYGGVQGLVRKCLMERSRRSAVKMWLL